MSETIQLFCFVFVILTAVTMHECGHAFAAKLFGDHTAEKEGRLSLNPMKHLDPMGSVMVPAILYLMQSPMLFGWARPVPIDSQQFRHERWGNFFVSLAGPATNIFLAWFSSLLLHANPSNPTLGNELMVMMISINCTLAAFNFLPIPPLDGARMIEALLPHKIAEKYRGLEHYSFFIIIGLILIPSLFHMPSPLMWILTPLRQSLLHLVTFLSGHGV